MNITFRINIWLSIGSSYARNEKKLSAALPKFLSVFEPIVASFGGRLSSGFYPDLSPLAQEVGGKEHAVLFLEANYPACGLDEAIRLHAIFENLAHLLNHLQDYQINVAFEEH